MNKIYVGQKILMTNEAHALKNSLILMERKIPCFNLISSPGSGKTSLLSKTIEGLKSDLRIAVIEGDIQTDLDARRIRATGALAVQINTDGACHLSAAQVHQALEQLPLDRLDLVFIENVGNLVCPGAFELGENGKVVVLSVAEGDDKPIKYPAIFAKAQVMLINKMDLLSQPGLIDFDLVRATNDARMLNKTLDVFPVSAKTGEGLGLWCDWLRTQVARARNGAVQR